MAWTLDLNNGITLTSWDGLTSEITPEVHTWIASNNNQLDVPPVHSIVTYDPTNEAMVLSATLNYINDVYGIVATVVKSTVEPYVASGEGYDAQRGLDY